jgi:hypothetical protein
MFEKYLAIQKSWCFLNFSSSNETIHFNLQEELILLLNAPSPAFSRELQVNFK